MKILTTKQAAEALRQLGSYIESTGRSAVIFPEGTRSKTGVPKPFKMYGLSLLATHAPSAQILPVSINNSWKLFRYGKFPHGLGAFVRFKVHPPVPVKDLGPEGLKAVEHTIISHVYPSE